MGRAYRPSGVRVRVPASSANLGPGFDALGLALGLYDDVELSIVSDGLLVEVTGEGARDVPTDESHLLVRAARAAFDRLGGQPAGLRLSCTNRIPHGRGLGSSAAAIVAGVVAASVLADPDAGPRGALSDDELLSLATELEGHPDNVAACLLGAGTIAWMEGPKAQAVRFHPAADLVPVAFVPTQPLSTEVARGLLPARVPHADAAANAGRAALLVHALTTDLSVLLAATEDRLHPGLSSCRDAGVSDVGREAASRRHSRCHQRRGRDRTGADQRRRSFGRGAGRVRAGRNSCPATDC
ncbi:homoserine kinase [Fodinicola feengrottensis]|uniref:homoserine kinase n=1 Tax=Fodinicola feengrottensis TaxID=435914 RepID=UPI002443569E|nr:homoserine kinase [Fodinicola feengrottensis]